MSRFLIACFVACLFVFAAPASTSAHEARFGHGYGLANGDRMFYGPGSGVEWRHRGPVRRTVCAALRGGRNIMTGNGPIARAWRSGRCSQ